LRDHCRAAPRALLDSVHSNARRLAATFIQKELLMARLQQCPCGSDEYPDAQRDGYGIFLCYTCSKCEQEKMSKYRSDIMERYETDEQIEEE
jgi:hypothetical protein